MCHALFAQRVHTLLKAHFAKQESLSLSIPYAKCGSTVYSVLQPVRTEATKDNMGLGARKTGHYTVRISSNMSRLVKFVNYIRLLASASTQKRPHCYQKQFGSILATEVVQHNNCIRRGQPTARAEKQGQQLRILAM